MPEYLAPGVYSERVDATAPTIAAVRTDVAGFVGIAARGPLHTPVPLESWRQYRAHFGDFIGGGFLAYAVRGFFENGGRRCWVVRVASNDPLGGALPARRSLRNGSGQVAWEVSAASPGTWGNELAVTLRETRPAQTVTPPGAGDPEASPVASTGGFGRADLVRLSQDGVEQLKVVSGIDPPAGLLRWVHPDAASRLPHDSPLTGFDAARPVFIEKLTYRLVVFAAGRAVALYENLSAVPEHPRYGPRLLAPWQPATEIETRDTLPAAPEPIAVRPAEPRADPLDPIDVSESAPLPLAGGRDGLALLSAGDFVGQPVDPRDSEAVRARKRLGLRALETVAEVAIVAVPDIHIQPVTQPLTRQPEPCIPAPCLPTDYVPPAPPRRQAPPELPPVFTDEEIYRVQAALIEQCEERRDRIAVIAPPAKAARQDELGIAAALAWRSRFDSKYAAYYYPWLRVVDPLRRAAGPTRDIPPCGHVAGQYARTDFETGVHKAPANAPLVWAQDATAAVADAVHGVLNPLGVNAILVLAGRGLRIMGARTLSSDPDWRFVNVRRLLMMIAKAIELSTQWAVFEPNSVYTRAKLRLSLTGFLLSLWEKGALVGSTAEQAFFVECDETNNPADQRANGKLTADVGVAPSQPFEFVVLRVGRIGNEFEISEVTERSGVAV